MKILLVLFAIAIILMALGIIDINPSLSGLTAPDGPSVPLEGMKLVGKFF